MAPFQSAWWLNNAHLQTIYPAKCRPEVRLPGIKRERLTTPDNDFIDIDFYGVGTQPIIILLHGLSGSAQSGYIRGMQYALWQHGFRSAVLNFRGCSGEPNRVARCYHSGETEDIHFLYQTLRRREPDTTIAAVGFSLGGNVLLKWLGEQGNQLNLSAAVAVSVPFVLSACATKMDSGFSRIYRNSLINELKEYIELKIKYLENIGNIQDSEKVRRVGNLTHVSSFWEYDHQVVAALHDYRDVYDYYQRASSRQFIKQIKIPTLLIQADDDPFMSKNVIPEQHELSATVQLEITHGGGHVGFVSGSIPFKPEFWLEHRIPEYLEKQLNH